ncbi:FBP domain-containing protein [Sphaerisporangium sp. NPDC088356]|uniref:FBP domain-containing protein n=1 Tax=Sphaerisporangium sp. NPDC088356 TaxID=3154871 RepID=UPI0034235531
MREVSERAIRASFVNCSKGEAMRLTVPRDLAERPWDDLDFLGWNDPKAPQRSYIVAERDDGLIGVVLHVTSGQHGPKRRSMCSLCLTTHSGGRVSLLAAKKARQTGKDDDSVGEYICTDLACSLYVRGKKLPEHGERLEESLTVEEKAERVRAKLMVFLDRLFV